MKISYGITVYDEIDEIRVLIDYLKYYIREEDEIVVVFDEVNGTEEVKNYLSTLENISVYPFKFEGNFSQLKNYLKSKCTGDYIFQIDADELVMPSLLNNLPEILEQYTPFILLVPRINLILEDIPSNVDLYEWIRSSEIDKRILWPDHQCRILKNIPEIKWVRKIHEILEGALMSVLPSHEDYCLIHIKDMKKEKEFFIFDPNLPEEMLRE